MGGVDHIVAVIALLGPPLDFLQDENVVGEAVGAQYSGRHEAAYRTRDRGRDVRALERFFGARLADGVQAAGQNLRNVRKR